MPYVQNNFAPNRPHLPHSYSSPHSNAPFSACIVCHNHPAHYGCHQYEVYPNLTRCSLLYCSSSCRDKDSQLHNPTLCADNERNKFNRAFGSGRKVGVEFGIDGEIRFVEVEMSDSGRGKTMPMLEKFFPKDSSSLGEHAATVISRNHHNSQSQKKQLELHYRRGFMSDKSDLNSAVQRLKVSGCAPRWKGPLIIMKVTPGCEHCTDCGSGARTYRDMSLKDIRDVIDWLSRGYWDLKEGERPGTEGWKPESLSLLSWLPGFNLALPGSYPPTPQPDRVKVHSQGVRLAHADEVLGNNVFSRWGEFDRANESVEGWRILDWEVLPQPVVPMMVGYPLEVRRMQNWRSEANDKLADLYYELPKDSSKEGSNKPQRLGKGDVIIHRTDGLRLQVEEVEMLCLFCKDLEKQMVEIEYSMNSEEVKRQLRRNVESLVSRSGFLAFTRGLRCRGDVGRKSGRRSAMKHVRFERDA